MIKAIIFDLDNCLAAADESGQELLEPVFCAIRRTNDGRFSEDALASIYFDCWRNSLDWVAAKHEFPPGMLSAAWSSYRHLEIQRVLTGYADLPVLGELPGMMFLVTSGFRRLQESKIKALGLERFFAEVHVDAIDEPDRRSKEKIFREILRDHSLRPEEILVVGDNPESEIETGNRLGFCTVQILRPGVPRGTNARHFIHSLNELKGIF